MGSKNSAERSGEKATDERPAESVSAPAASSAVADFSSPEPPQFAGFATAEDARKRIVSDALAARVAAALPAELQARRPPRWFLLFNSDVHGRSFSRLVQLIADRGPTVLVVRDGDSGRVFGGFCEASWQTVAGRERAAKSAAAAVARARREGYEAPSSRPAKQSPVFFGTAGCFLFAAHAADGSDAPTVYASRPDLNANFQYLFDTHPNDDSVGIGMGGQPGRFGFFLDRFLERGSCAGPRCTTFWSPMLSVSEQWAVDAVEAYAVAPDVVDELVASAVVAEGGRTMVDTGETVLRRGPDGKVDQMLLELHCVHQFRCDEVQSREDQ